MIILSWFFIYVAGDFAYFDINCLSSICLTDYPFFIELSWHICWMGTGVLKCPWCRQSWAPSCLKVLASHILGLSRVDKDLAGSGSKFSNLLQTNSVVVAYVYIVKRGDKRRGWQRQQALVALTVFVFFFIWWRFGTFTHCKTDGSLRCPQLVYCALDVPSNSWQFWAIFYSGVTVLQWDFWGACVASHQRSTNTGCLVCIPLSLLSEPLHRERWCLCTSWHSAQSMCTQVRAHLLPSMAFCG